MKEPDFNGIWDRGLKKLAKLTKDKFKPKLAGTLWLVRASDQPIVWDPNNFEPINRRDEYFLVLRDETMFEAIDVLWLRKNQVCQRYPSSFWISVDTAPEHATLSPDGVSKEK